VHFRQEFVVVGYTDPEGSRRGFGALLLAIHDADRTLRYAGKVGTGFDGATLKSVHAQLERLASEPRRLRSGRPRRVALGAAEARRRGVVLRVDTRRPHPPRGVPRAAQRQARRAITKEEPCRRRTSCAAGGARSVSARRRPSCRRPAHHAPGARGRRPTAA
jgi:hypothetical protein